MMPGLEYSVRMSDGRNLEPNEAVSMPAEIRFIDPLVDPAWDALVLSHSEANIFHSSAWAKVLARSYGHKPIYLQVVRHGAVEALVPLMEVRSLFTGRRAVCLPFSDFCGPLFFGGRDTSIIFERLSTMARERNWSYFEIRDQFPSVPALQFYGHKLDLCQSTQALFAGCSSAVRRAIRKAEKSGVKAERLRSWESVLDFYRLHVETRRRHGLPPQPVGFFRNIFREVIEPGLGFVVRATLGSRCVAAAIFLQFGRTAIYKFGASALAFQRFRGNNLVMWAGIRLLAQGDSEVLSFGRTALSNQSLRRFKLGWGPEEEIITYCKWNTSSAEWITRHDYSSGRHGAVFSRMPLVLTRLAGTLLYPHLD
jgi:Acetyltransferase (GNAT) domain